jgi:DNA primase
LSVRIPEEKISEIKNSVNIVDLISEVVRLKKAGKNFVGLCPFHSEKTPSFTVSPDKQIFYCFGCGQGGDIFHFLMKQDNLSYPEAIRSLAVKVGIPVAESETFNKGPLQKTDKERVLEINQEAMRFFRETLKNDKTGKPASLYLTNRGIAPAIIDRFTIGYAPNAWNGLSGFFFRKRISASDLEKAGLAISRKESAGVYDRFRNRIIFPIMDIRMQTIGFGGRSIDDQMPKYLNSPETPAYVKSRSLFGLHLAKDKCRTENAVYIVEGYFDCIMLHQYGVENTVATLGTSLTAEQIRILKGYAEKMILVFDSDDAGIKAAARSIALFVEQNVKARILVLPTGHDPDSYMREFGAKSFEGLAKKASDAVGFLIDCAVKKHGMTPEGKLLVLQDLIEPLAAVTDPVARSLYIREFSERLSVDETAISDKINQHSKNTGGVQVRPTESDFRFELQSSNGSKGYQDLGLKGCRLERRIVAMMLQFTDIISDIINYDVLENFENKHLRSIGETILKAADKGGHFVSEVLSGIEDEEVKLTVLELAISDDIWEHAGCVRLIHQFLENAKVRREKDFLHLIKAAEKKDDQELLLRLLNEKQKKAVQHKKEKMSRVRGCLKE